MAPQTHGYRDLAAAVASLLECLLPEVQQLVKVVTPEIGPRYLLAMPEDHRVNALYVGCNYRYIVANPGDVVTVHAWFEGYAVAFNPRNKTGGLIPKAFLDEKEIVVEVQPDVVAMINTKLAPTVEEVPWVAGDHLRICEWEEGRRDRGFAVNLRTLEVGKFAVTFDHVRMIKNT